MQSEDRPYVLFVAEIIYSEISEIKKKNPNFSNVAAIESFIGSKTYLKISSGKFHDEWFESMKKNNFIDKKTNKKIPEETLRILKIQKDMMIKQLVVFPELYYTKTRSPLKISQRAFDQLWRICESYELWCLETNQKNLIVLKITD